MEPNQEQRWQRWSQMSAPLRAGWELRPLLPRDADAVHASVDDQVRRWLTGQAEFRPDDATRLVAETAPQLAAKGHGAMWAIAQVPLADEPAHGDASSQLRGVVTLRRHDGDADRAQVGWWLAAPVRGRGVAAAAARALASMTLAPGGLSMLTWEGAVGNVDSLRVARAAGFTPTGSTRITWGPQRLLVDGWRAERGRHDVTADRTWADCLVEIAAGAWQLQPMATAEAVIAEAVLPVSACQPTAVWAAKEITTARVDAVVALLHRADRAWVLAQPAWDGESATAAAQSAVDVVARYARRALGLTTP